MGVWYIVLLAMIVGTVVNDHPPSNPPYLLEEVKARAESRVLERVEELLQNLSAKMKVLDDLGDEMKRDISRLFVLQNETHEMLKTTNKSLGTVTEKLHSFATSTQERMIDLEYKLERLPGNTGVYLMMLDDTDSGKFAVSRDFTKHYGFGDDWIVFQRRFNGSVDFNRNWTEYKHGFGDLHGEHWLGLDKLHAIVETRRHELLIVLEDFDDVIAYANYDDFKIGDESERYIIKSVGKYTGTAGDSFSFNKFEVFSTYDRKNIESCTQTYRGAWWFFSCYFSQSHLNGEYLKTVTDGYDGIIWKDFRGEFYTLKSTKMMVRPVT